MDFRELPDDAFTELEREAGVPSILAGRSWAKIGAEVKEVVSDVSHDEIVELLVKGVCGSGFEIEVATQPPLPPHASIGLYALDGCSDAARDDIFLRVDYDGIVSVASLIEAIRSSGMPLIVENEWLSWDKHEQQLRHSGFGPVEVYQRPLIHWPEKSMDDAEMRLQRVLRKAIWSTDHGKKPFIVKKDLVEDALGCNQIEFAPPRVIAESSVADYALAYYDCFGQGAAVELKQAVALGFPIVTRSGKYSVKEGRVVPSLNEAKLLASAFLIASRFNPNQFEWFSVRKRGTLFHSVIERIEPPRNDRSTFRQGQVVFTAYYGEEALDAAKQLVAMAGEIGDIYITSGQHPVEADLVTTPQHYLNAVETLQRYGYTVQYNISSGVTLCKTPAAETPVYLQR